MPEIPPSIEADAEDVVWGLQTADALWKRGERIDAVVWLRRAAQAAMDTNALARAVELGRIAAELSDFLASAPSQMPPAASTEDIPASGPDISIDISTPSLVPDDVPPEETVQTMSAAPITEGTEGPASTGSVQPAPSVPPAEQVHAGMFNPWDERASAPAPTPSAAPVVAAEALAGASGAPGPMRARSPSMTFSGSSDDGSPEEVLTSVTPGSLQGAPPVVVPPAPIAPRVDLAQGGSTAPPAGAPPRKPPPLPPRAKKPPVPPARPSDVDVETSAPRVPAAPESVPVDLDETEAPSPAPPVVSAPPPVVSAPPPVVSAPPPVVSVPPRPAPPPPVVSAPPPPVAAASPALDLESVDAFSDLPDDARAAFAAAAKVDRLAEGDEVSHFALAYVVEGEVDVAATMVDAPAMRLRAGAVLRSRGTTNEVVPMRLVAVGAGAVTATWSDGEVEKAFKSIPWVEEDLRTAADRMLTLVGITIGPLGERLDPSIREAIVARLEMRTLAPGEVIVQAGQPVPGLLLVGLGELQLAKPEGAPAVVGSGEFLFPTEVLGAGAAPYTASAGAGGALVMFGDRHVAQELLVTCPPLLEVFAGM